MNRIEKFLSRLEPARRFEAEQVITRVLSGDLSRLDVKKLGGGRDRYRVRVGRLRIQFVRSAGNIRVLSIGFRDSQTY